MATEKIAVYKEKNPESLKIVTTYSSYYYEFNTTKPPFDNPLVRKAFAYAVDRDLIVGSVTKGGEDPAYSVIPNDPQGYIPNKLFEFNVEKAKQYLADAGYPNGEGFPVTELLYNNDEVHKKVALALQQMLKTNLNINVQLFNQEWKVYLKSRKNKDYDFARAARIADYVDPSNFFELFFSYSQNNRTGWGSDKYDELVKLAQSAKTQEERFALFEEANEILFEDMPVLPVFYYSDVNLVLPTVEGWYENVMHYYRYHDVDFTVSPEQ